MLSLHQHTLAVCLVVAALLAHSTEAKRGILIVNCARGPGTVDLGTAADFAILAKSFVSTVAPSVIIGDVGVSPIARSALTGFVLAELGTRTTSEQVKGYLYAASDTAPTPAKLTAAVGDMGIAYTDAASRVDPDHVEYMSGALGGATLSPGLYKFATSVGFSTDCTLSGSSEDTWIFQIGGDMSIAASVGKHLGDGRSETPAEKSLPNVGWETSYRLLLGKV